MLEEAILKTLIYRDLFDYPLTVEEVWELLIGKRAAKAAVGEGLAQLESRGIVGKKGGFYFLSNRGGIVSLRRKREALSREKMQRARRYVGFLRIIPWVRAIFITGAVAAGNAGELDDLDILVIADPKRLWLTRLLVFLALISLGVKRGVGAKAASNKICPNMFFVVTALKLPKNEQNMYTACEIAQAKPLWERGPVHQLFLAENSWIGKFLPNFNLPPEPKLSPSKRRFPPLDWLESFVYKIQLAYMAKRRTKEIVTPERILFHSQDLPSKILNSYQKRLKEFLVG